MQINVIEYLIDSTQRYPNKKFLVGSESNYTFHEVLFLTLELAKKIRSRGDRYNRPIPVIGKKSPEAVISFFAILASRNIYCPIDVASGPERIGRMLANLNPNVVFADAVQGDTAAQIVKLEDVKNNLVSNLPEVSDIVCEIQILLKGQIDTDPAYIIHTSGSTGTPKGVTICHRSIVDYIEWARNEYQHTCDDKILSQAPFHFDNSTLDIYLSLAVGAELHIVPDAFYTFMPKLIEYINLQGITSVFWVPSVLVNMANLKLLDKMKVHSLTKVLFAGEVMPVPQLNYWIRHLPNALFSNLYGPTEITVDCTFFTLKGEWTKGDSLPIGYPCRNSGVLVLNENNELAKANELGELCVRGSSLALGYWNMPEKTKEVFTQNPLVKEYNEVIYRTGDLVRQDEKGLIFFVGRKDSQIKHNGYRIELGEIEAVIASMSEVKQVVVIYVPEKKKIVAVYLSETPIAIEQFTGFLAERLPSYMLPAVYHRLEEYPLNANGKVDRLVLSAMVKDIL